MIIVLSLINFHKILFSTGKLPNIHTNNFIRKKNCHTLLLGNILNLGHLGALKEFEILNL